MSTIIPGLWAEHAMSHFLSSAKMAEYEIRDQFIFDVMEYQSLPARRWHRKRQLEKSIAMGAKYWLPDIRKIQARKSKLKIPKISQFNTLQSGGQSGK